MVVAGPATSTATTAGVTVTHLRCERLPDPTAIDAAHPRFSWQLQSGQQDQRQLAYQVVVDGVWDSGRVASDRSVGVAYGGAALAPAARYTWRVRVWDAQNQPSAWSEPATFGTALGQWSATWIGLDQAKQETFAGAQWIWFPEGDPSRAAPIATRQFRRTLTLPAGSKPIAATCLVTADNAFELSVNGQAVGSGDTLARPVTFDVAPLLHAGANAVQISARNVGDAPNPAGLIAKLHVLCRDQTTADLATDGQWEASANGAAWQPAKALGAYGVGPWGRVAEDSRVLPARYLRREFTVPKPPVRATVYACGLGFFKLSVNGQPVSDDVMDPALSDYKKADYYLAFDVTRQLKPGANAVGVVLGNGRFYAPRTSVPIATATFGNPKLLFQLKLEYADGTTQTLVSDGAWRLTDRGPIRADNEYDGETYDARMEMPGWDQVGYHDADWQPAEVVAAPGGALLPQTIEPMRVTQRVKPIGITSPAPETYVVDMGQNFYGAVQLRASAPRGTEVRLTSAYAVNADGTLKTADNRSALSTDAYTFKGTGTETWSPVFRGQGFRRVQVTGLPAAPTVDNFAGLVIHTDVEPVGDFACSNDLVNRLHRALRWGARMFLRSEPLDPDRDERQAWAGDPAKDAEAEAYNFDVASFYAKYMDDVRRSQRRDKTIPDVATYWTMGNGVEWPSVFTIIPSWIANFYDDSSVANTNYDAMKAWVLSMRRHQRPDGTLGATSYGDWCDTYTIGGKTSDYGATPRDLISTAYQYNNCRIMQRLAKAGGHADDEREFAKLADDLRAAFNRKFLDPQTHVYQGDTQCAYVLPLAFGLVPDDQRAAVVDRLVNDIVVKHQGHLSVGLIGMQWLMQTLSDVGRPDVAWTIATQTTRPSWGYMLSKGATTIWERWDYDTRDPGMNSEALLIQAGNLDAWFYQTLAGIRPAAPGFKKVLIQPAVVGDLTWVKCHFDSPYGRIESNWTLRDGRLTLDVTVPVNTTATVIVPGETGGGHEVGSGRYRFTAHGPFR